MRRVAQRHPEIPDALVVGLYSAGRRRSAWLDKCHHQRNRWNIARRGRRRNILCPPKPVIAKLGAIIL